MTAYPLAPTLDTAAATPLRQELLARLDLGQPLLLDGAGVERVGQACLQTLAAARASAAAAGLSFAVADPSEPLADMAALAGLGAVLAPLA